MIFAVSIGNSKSLCSPARLNTNFPFEDFDGDIKLNIYFPLCISVHTSLFFTSISLYFLSSPSLSDLGLGPGSTPGNGPGPEPGCGPGPGLGPFPSPGPLPLSSSAFGSISDTFTAFVFFFVGSIDLPKIFLIRVLKSFFCNFGSLSASILSGKKSLAPIASSLSSSILVKLFKTHVFIYFLNSFKIFV